MTNTATKHATTPWCCASVRGCIMGCGSANPGTAGHVGRIFWEPHHAAGTKEHLRSCCRHAFALQSCWQQKPLVCGTCIATDMRNYFEQVQPCGGTQLVVAATPPCSVQYFPFSSGARTKRASYIIEMTSKQGACQTCGSARESAEKRL